MASNNAATKAINSNKPNPGLNHRERMRERFDRNGFDGFHDYEILEFLLFFIFRQGDTKPKAKALIEKFGTFSKVLDAPTADIAAVAGMGEKSAMALKAIRAAIAHYFKDSAFHYPRKISTSAGLAEYAKAIIGDKQYEVIFSIFLNAANEIIESKIISEGTVTESAAFPRKIAEAALKNNAASVVLAHNHPGGSCKPSENDIRMTREIRASLALIGINLVEHIIIASGDYFSFIKSGYL